MIPVLPWVFQGAAFYEKTKAAAEGETRERLGAV